MLHIEIGSVPISEDEPAVGAPIERRGTHRAKFAPLIVIACHMLHHFDLKK
jgi:hypothetical protein